MSDDPSSTPAAICKDECAGFAPVGTIACATLFPEFEEWCGRAGTVADNACEFACDLPPCDADTPCSGKDQFGKYLDTCIDKKCSHKYTEAECNGAFSTYCKNGTVFQDQQCKCKPPSVTCADVWNSVATECDTKFGEDCCLEASYDLGFATCNKFPIKCNDANGNKIPCEWPIPKSWFWPPPPAKGSPGDWNNCTKEL